VGTVQPVLAWIKMDVKPLMMMMMMNLYYVVKTDALCRWFELNSIFLFYLCLP
jgi:hypothetical protein